ncbi:DNA methyltransferase [Pseudomonas syringae pv. syringae]|uniref:DNA methyltransferase n=1 Tax=Pseudomonas syringae TaxID=317 RepID=UPI002E7AFB9C|nr:DNA methyltransferase [Pseudomonas syringae]MEE1993056.1 DNA methyltransferase [Pseudomonas syringae pv. syringae]MEE1999232.1 DNA methyltransferase [Pseudomonas syringae pv. syringae]
MIGSPKRKASRNASSDEFYPYYAGFPLSFATDLIESAELKEDSIIYDPWNGSGTTTYAASTLGYRSFGLDLNPVMVIVAKARLIHTEDMDYLISAAKGLLSNFRSTSKYGTPEDPLSDWFDEKACALIRSLERHIFKETVREILTPEKDWTESFSPVTCGLYVSLFSTCRELLRRFKTSNPTWLRAPKHLEKKLSLTRQDLLRLFSKHIDILSSSVRYQKIQARFSESVIEVGNTISHRAPEAVDLILTSPPYCTRIDYTAATRVELSLLHPLLRKTNSELSREMIGSIKVGKIAPEPDGGWGPTCLEFLKKLKEHPSKASTGYYYKTHVDYFEKMSKSITHICNALKPDGRAILVVQDSHYKEIHNDVPKIITEMANSKGLYLTRKVDFTVNNTFANLNPRSLKYRATGSATESVLCYRKSTK